MERGVRVLLPREEGRLSKALRVAGVQVTCAPLQRREVLPAHNTMPGSDWVAVTSVRTVTSLAALGWRIPDDTRIAAVGEGTKQALTQDGYEVDLVPDAVSGISALADQWPAGTGRVVVPGSALMPPTFVEALTSLGYTAELLPIYTMQMLEHAPEEILGRWQDGGFDVLLVTSPSMAMAVGKLLGYRPETPVVALGSTTAAILSRIGVEPASVSLFHDPDSVLDHLRAVVTGA
ncbi:MAG: uroporphyrinogen-III synthase [Arachnia sp.]